MRYDADRQPDSEAWLGLDEEERIDIVMAYHRQKRVRLENAKVHAVAHVIVENQIALGSPPLVTTTMSRLMQEGLDRHDAIHAVGSVILGALFDAMRQPGKASDLSPEYNSRLAALTAASWRAQVD